MCILMAEGATNNCCAICSLLKPWAISRKICHCRWLELSSPGCICGSCRGRAQQIQRLLDEAAQAGTGLGQRASSCSGATTLGPASSKGMKAWRPAAQATQCLPLLLTGRALQQAQQLELLCQPLHLPLVSKRLQMIELSGAAGGVTKVGQPSAQQVVHQIVETVNLGMPGAAQGSAAPDQPDRHAADSPAPGCSRPEKRHRRQYC